MLILVRLSKTIQFRECTISISLPAIPNSILCPVVAICHAFSLTNSCTDSSQAFCWLDQTTLRLRSFTYRNFFDKLRRCLGSLGLPAELYATHSLTTGGASFAFQAGVLIEMIKLLGDWKSNAVFDGLGCTKLPTEHWLEKQVRTLNDQAHQPSESTRMEGSRKTLRNRPIR